MGTSSSLPVPAILEPFRFGWENNASGTALLLITTTNIPGSLRTVNLPVNAKELHKTCARVQLKNNTELANAVDYITQFQL